MEIDRRTLLGAPRPLPLATSAIAAAAGRRRLGTDCSRI